MLIDGYEMQVGKAQDTPLGNAIRRKRESQGKTLQDVAADLPITASTLGQIERGEIIRPPDEVLRAIGRALNMSVGTLTGQADREAAKGFSAPAWKAATDQSTALVEAVGLPHAWQAISAAAEDKIPAASKGPLLQSIAAEQLSRAAATVKADGLTPEVLDLLQMLLDLMRGQAQPAPATEPPMPAAAPGELEASAKADARKGLPPAETDSLSLREEKKDPPPLNPPLRKQEGDNDKLPPPEQVGGGVLSGPERDEDLTEEADTFKADPRRKGLPPAETDSLSLREEKKDPPPLNPALRKARDLVFGRQDDIAPRTGPKPKTYHFGTHG